MLRPWMLPVGMTLWNAAYLIFSLFAECRIKPNVLRYTFMYATTIGPAMRGDLDPFFVVFTMPPL